MYASEFDEDWVLHFDRLDNSVKIKIAKKVNNILGYPYKRHLKKSAKFFVTEVSQYRIVYSVFEDDKKVRFYFVGKHKDYENWHKQF